MAARGRYGVYRKLQPRGNASNRTKWNNDLRQLDEEETESKPTTRREHRREFSKLSSEQTNNRERSDRARQTHTMFIAQLSQFKFVLLFSATLEKSSPGQSCPTLYNLA